MERMTRFRARILMLVFVLIAGYFAFQLYKAQVIDTGGSTDNTSTFTTYTTVKAARGEILDRNGNVLVSNRASYDLTINHYVLLSANGTNQYLYDLVKRCQEAGIAYNESFPISKERPFTYTLEEQSSAQQGYFQQYLAYMEDLDSDITAPLLVEELRERYNLPATWTDEEARQVIGLRYELALRNCVGSLSKFVLITDASDEELSAVVELNIPGLSPEASTVREIHTKYAAHILGYVGPMTAEQWEHYKTIDGYEMDAEVGQDGFEAKFEEYLHGVNGLREDVVTTDGTLVSSRYIKEPQAGTNVEVSIDLNLQMIAEDQMAIKIQELHDQGYYEDGRRKDGSDAEGCAVVAMDMEGQVLVCASYPTYDLSRFFEDYTQILEAEGNPLYNRALMAAYPPGSTYKVSMVIAAIDSGLISSGDTIYDASVYRAYESSGFAPQCLLYTNAHMTHGDINASEALRDSCNYFFYYLGDRIRLSAMDDTAKALGLGEHTGIELYEEIGHRANAETKKEIHPDDPGWYAGDQILAAIGQSDNLFTPMQLCSYAAALANRGDRYRGTFLNRVVSADYTTLEYQSEPEILSHLEISDDAYLAYSEGMYKVTSESSGTAYSTFQNYPIAVCAKTGTAQQEAGGSDHGAFICYAPKEDPQIAIAIYGEKAGHGSSMAGIAKAILDAYFQVDEVGDVSVYENQLS